MNISLSSNGRTSDFESDNARSIRAGETNRVYGGARLVASRILSDYARGDIDRYQPGGQTYISEVGET